MLFRIVAAASLLATACASGPEAVETVSEQHVGQRRSTATAPIEKQRLDPASALVDELILDGEVWSGQTSAHLAYEPLGPFTDCEPLNLFDTRRQYHGVSRDDPIDGVVVAHAVYDVGTDAEGLRDAAGRIALDCAEMSWLDGGSTTNHPLQVELPQGWVGYRQGGPSSYEVSWTAAASRQNLLSVVVAYMPIDEGEPPREFPVAAMVLEADRALQEATRGNSGPIADLGLTFPHFPLDLPVLPATTTTTTILDAGDLSPYLLSEDDIGQPIEFEHEGSFDAAEFAGCPNSDAFARFFSQMEIEGATPEDEAFGVGQLIGPISDRAATRTTLSELEEFATCVVSEDEASGVTYERLVEAPGPIVDAASIAFSLPSPTEDATRRWEMVVVQFDDAVVALVLGEQSGVSTSEMLEIMAAKG